MLATRIAAILSALATCAAVLPPGANAQLRVCQWNITNWDSASVPARAAAFQTCFYGTVPSGMILAGQSISPDIIVAQEISQGLPAPALPLPVSDTYRATGQINVDYFLALLNNVDYTAGGTYPTVHTNPSIVSPGDWAVARYIGNQGDTGNALFYRTSKIELIPYDPSPLPNYKAALTLGTLGVDVCSLAAAQCNASTNQAARDNQRWRIRLVGYTGPGAELYIYGGHYKSGSASSDQLRRDPEARRIRANANTLPAGIGGFIMAGDFNIQSSAQRAYRYLTEYSASPLSDYDSPSTTPPHTADDPDPRLFQAGQFVDPIRRPGSWNNNCDYRNIDTQEPGANNGGMDDRHDQILLSASLLDGQGMSYMPGVVTATTSAFLSRILTPFITATSGCPTSTTATEWNDPNHSYRCWGNDGNHFNAAINANGFNTQVGTVMAAALITTTAGNGHLPVFLDMQVPAVVGAPATIDFGTVTLNAAASTILSITNAADVARYSKNGTGWGVDGLTYTLAASTGFTAPGGTFERSATGAPAQANSHTITMNTSSTGPKMGTITITSDDPDHPTFIINLTGNVAAATVTCCKGTTCTTTLTPSQCTTPDGNGLFGQLVTSCDSNHTSNTRCCYADFNHSGVSNTDDIFIFLNAWFASSPYAHVDGNGTITPNVDDIFLFLNAWFAGCTNP